LVKDFSIRFHGIRFKTEFARISSFGATKDGFAVTGNYKPLSNSFSALVFSGNCFTFSVIYPQIITALIKGKKNKDTKNLSFDRVLV